MIIGLQVLAGLVLLFFGGDNLVRGSVALAHRLGVSYLVIGLTVVAFCTSAPELFVALTAALEGAPGVAVGTVVGSNIANLLLVLGAAGLVYPIARNTRSLQRDGVVGIGATILFLAFCFAGTIRLWHGAVMLCFLVAFIVISYRSDRQSRAATAEKEEEVRGLEPRRQAGWLVLVRLFGGIAAVLVGSDLLVDGAVGVARGLGVSDAVIGITLVAFGTSLPELATALVAAFHRHTDLALGNALGSNIFNILAIMGIVSVVTPVPIPEKIINFDVWVMLAVAVAFVALAAMVRRISRPMALFFLMIYAAYIFIQFSGISTSLS
jgi:cation:H+ antiporter